jgi:hypothetical protein
MRLEDYQKVVYTDLMGIYRRGQEDTIPKDHLFDSLNIQHGIRQWKTRDGLTPSIFPAFPFHIRRFAFFSGILLILDDQGNLYTYSQRVGDNASVANALINIGAEDFAAIQMLGKIFISFHDGQKGLTGINIKVLIPHPTNPALDEIRDAAGLAPLGLGGTPMIAADGAAGIVNAGVYKIAVAYITSTGFITQPGPKIAGVFTPTVYTSPGSVKIDLSNIPTGPGLVGLQRQILITKAGLEEYFFLGSAFGGILPADGVTSTAILDFNDTTDLVQSADFLFDLLETIPAAVTLQNYNGRLMTGGEADPNNSIMVMLNPLVQLIVLFQ